MTRTLASLKRVAEAAKGEDPKHCFYDFSLIFTPELVAALVNVAEWVVEESGLYDCPPADALHALLQEGEHAEEDDAE